MTTALLDKEPRERVIEECVQVACVAMRIASEGDGDFDNAANANRGDLA